jgi:predicted transcriptional regulator
MRKRAEIPAPPGEEKSEAGAPGMRLDAIRDLLQCVVLTGEDRLNVEVDTVAASDGMSAVLAVLHPRALLVTGLTNIQSVRTAHVADMAAVLYVRGVRPNEKTIEFAREKKIVLFVTAFGMFDSCGILRDHGLKGAL